MRQTPEVSDGGSVDEAVTLLAHHY